MSTDHSISSADTTSPKYGFYDRLKSEFPSQVIVDATEICNLACIHCPHPDFKKSEHYSGRSLDLELHAKMVAEVLQHQNLTQYIRYTSNGEPLLHKHIFEMLSHAVAHSGTTVTLTTNGTLLNEQRMEKLLATQLHVIDISIDAFTAETYAQIRVNGQLEVTRGNVLRLIDQIRTRQLKTKVVVSYVEQPKNTHETAAFEKFWKESGAHYVVIRRLHSAAGAVTPIADTLRSAEGEEPRRPCLYPWERILLNPRGELAFCPQDWNHGSVVADYRTTTIKETWQGEFYRKLREAHLKNVFANHPFCGQCPDWKGTRWPHEGRSYADMVEEFKQNPQS